MILNFLKKLKDKIGNLEQNITEFKLAFLAFWNKKEKVETCVISTQGIIEKVSNVPKSGIEKAKKLRLEYFN
jgi:hypothetical protein